MARISRRYPTLAALLRDGNLLASAISEEGDGLPSLQTPRERLEGKLDRLRELSVRVDALQAEKQGLVQEMHELQEDAAKLMSFLHLGVKNSFGARSEKLAKFGVQPFRGLKRSRKKAADSVAAPEASEAAAE